MGKVKLMVYGGGAAFVLGCAILAFAYGAYVGVYKVYPYEVLVRAKQAAESLTELISPDQFVKKGRGRGVTVLDEHKVFNGLTFFSGYRDGFFKGILIDLRGNILHEWNVRFSQVWDNPLHVIKKAADNRIRWHGSHLYPNGDLILNFEDGNFPMGGGLVKIDKDSNILWSLARNTHHDVDVLPDGTIVAAAMNYREEGLPGVTTLEAPYYEDVVLRISPDGKVIGEISIIKALWDSPFKGLLFPMHGNQVTKLYSWDPTHLNDVEVVTRAFAKTNPIFTEGDILVSLPAINSLVLIDSATHRAKWALTGAFIYQHDPDFRPDGTILIYDNMGGMEESGWSQLVAIDPMSQEIVWRYTGTQEQPFFSPVQGKQQLLENGNVLVAEATTGRIFEITSDGDVVWEFNNDIPETSDGESISSGVVSDVMRKPEDWFTFLKVRNRPETDIGSRGVDKGLTARQTLEGSAKK